MMTEAEVQLLCYVEGILRSRGYTDLAEQTAAVVGAEAERRARLLTPPSPVEWRATG